MVSCPVQPNPESMENNQHNELNSIMIQGAIDASNDSKVNIGLGKDACNPAETIPYIPSDLIVRKAGGGKKKLIMYTGKFNNLKTNFKASGFLDAAKAFSKKLNKKFKIDETKNKNKFTFSIINTNTDVEKKYELINERVKHKLYNFKHTLKQIK